MNFKTVVRRLHSGSRYEDVKAFDTEINTLAQEGFVPSSFQVVDRGEYLLFIQTLVNWRKEGSQ